MSHTFPRCPGAVYASSLPMKGSSQECHNLSSYWTRERGVIHELPSHEKDVTENSKTNPDYMKMFNDHLLRSYAQVAIETSLLIEEMWMESTGFFPLEENEHSPEKPSIRFFYRAILNASGTASALSHLHNLVKQDLSETFKPTVHLKINSQLLVR